MIPRPKFSIGDTEYEVAFGAHEGQYCVYIDGRPLSPIRCAPIYRALKAYMNSEFDIPLDDYMNKMFGDPA